MHHLLAFWYHQGSLIILRCCWKQFWRLRFHVRHLVNFKIFQGHAGTCTTGAYCASSACAHLAPLPSPTGRPYERRILTCLFDPRHRIVFSGGYWPEMFLVRVLAAFSIRDVAQRSLGPPSTEHHQSRPTPPEQQSSPRSHAPLVSSGVRLHVAM